MKSSMLKNNKHIFCISILSMILCFLTACQNKADAVNTLNCPFTELSWDASLDDIKAYENNDYESYASMYQGTTYTFPKDYLGKAGTIKYMTDDKDALKNVSWLYVGEDKDDVMEVYKSIIAEMKKEYGEPNDNSDNVNNYGEIWKLDTGNIVVNAVVTSDAKMVQIGFMHPSVSDGNPQNPKTTK